MRWGALLMSGGLPLVLLVLPVGCASGPPAARPAAPPVAQSATAAPWVYDRAVAASLVYAPPIAAGNAPGIEFTREGRAPAAYAGFDDVITTYYYLWQDDRQGGWGWGCPRRDRFERDAVTVRTGVSYR